MRTRKSNPPRSCNSLGGIFGIFCRATSCQSTCKCSNQPHLPRQK